MVVVVVMIMNDRAEMRNSIQEKMLRWARELKNNDIEELRKQANQRKSYEFGMQSLNVR